MIHFTNKNIFKPVAQLSLVRFKMVFARCGNPIGVPQCLSEVFQALHLKQLQSSSARRWPFLVRSKQIVELSISMRLWPPRDQCCDVLGWVCLPGEHVAVVKLTSVIPEHWEGRGSNEKETRSHKQAITLQKKKKNEFERELTIRVPTQTTKIQKVKKRADFNRTVQNLCWF